MTEHIRGYGSPPRSVPPILVTYEEGDGEEVLTVEQPAVPAPYSVVELEFLSRGEQVFALFEVLSVKHRVMVVEGKPRYAGVFVHVIRKA